MSKHTGLGIWFGRGCFERCDGCHRLNLQGTMASRSRERRSDRRNEDRLPSIIKIDITAWNKSRSFWRFRVCDSPTACHQLSRTRDRYNQCTRTTRNYTLQKGQILVLRNQSPSGLKAYQKVLLVIPFELLSCMAALTADSFEDEGQRSTATLRFPHIQSPTHDTFGKRQRLLPSLG